MGVGKSAIQENFEKPQKVTTECTCSTYVDDSCACPAEDHHCSCCTIIWDDMVFSKFVLACQSRDLHTCICARQVAGTIIEPGVLYCRSITGHECVCNKLQPSECQAYRHCWCVCMQLSPEKCRADESEHFCTCWLFSCDQCRVRGREHHCTCSVSPAECKSRYGYHTCVCSGAEIAEGAVNCRARIHMKKNEVSID